MNNGEVQVDRVMLMVLDICKGMQLRITWNNDLSWLFVCDTRLVRVFVVDAEISGTSPQHIMSSLMDKCCCMLLHYNELL